MKEWLKLFEPLLKYISNIFESVKPNPAIVEERAEKKDTQNVVRKERAENKVINLDTKELKLREKQRKAKLKIEENKQKEEDKKRKKEERKAKRNETKK